MCLVDTYIYILRIVYNIIIYVIKNNTILRNLIWREIT